jgi:glutamyl-Q tRNA(Asp) synthetase
VRHREQISAPPVFRFAPSPTGKLHLGHALSALLNAQLARERGGRFLLRIENIDAARSREAHIAAIFEDLHWLGLDWPKPVLRQSTRFAAYDAALDEVNQQGLVYPCFCTRKQILRAGPATGVARHDPEGALRYPGTCRTLSADEIAQRMAAGEAYSWRLNMDLALPGIAAPLIFSVEDAAGDLATRLADPARWGDVVLARKDTPTSYHLAVVVDDAFQDITHVVRGRDLEAATDIHLVLQKLLGLPVPVYRFHKLVLGQDGEKLAKSLGSQSLDDLRRSGVTPVAIRQQLGFG